MSSDAIITVEGLGKRYRLGAGRSNERYTALRDVISDKARSIFRNPKSAIRNGSEANASEFWALKDVSFEVKQGEVVGIIGRNGAGKSTLLKILSRITEPTEGRIKIKGRVASLLEVGTGFHPELTGRENIFLNGAILGMHRAEIKAKFDEIVAFAEVEKFLDTPVKRFSSGMYVRLAFAVAAHLEPEILVVDEVLAVGDAEFQKKCLGKMQDVAKGGRTVLFVSHNMAAIQALCGRGMCLRQGRAHGIGDLEEEISTYLSDSQGADNQAFVGEHQVGDALTLRCFELSPNPVECGKALAFRLEFYASKATKINELAVLIYSTFGVRVGILDLRSSEIPKSLTSGQVVEWSGEIRSFAIVEGDYKMGLYILGGSFAGDILDLVTLTVLPSSNVYSFPPYSPRSRGVVEFSFSARPSVLLSK